MLVCGLILVIIGFVAMVYSLVQRGTGEYMLASAFGSEEAIIINVILYAGIALLVVGAILLVMHFSKNKK